MPLPLARLCQYVSRAFTHRIKLCRPLHALADTGAGRWDRPVPPVLEYTGGRPWLWPKALLPALAEVVGAVAPNLVCIVEAASL